MLLTRFFHFSILYFPRNFSTTSAVFPIYKNVLVHNFIKICVLSEFMDHLPIKHSWLIFLTYNIESKIQLSLSTIFFKISTIFTYIFFRNCSLELTSKLHKKLCLLSLRHTQIKIILYTCSYFIIIYIFIFQLQYIFFFCNLQKVLKLALNLVAWCKLKNVHFYFRKHY